MGDEICFVDVETTGLDADQHEIWEVAAIDGETGREYRWFLDVDLAKADVKALNIGRYHDRHPHGHNTPGEVQRQRPPSVEPGDPGWQFTVTAERFARQFAKLTWDKHLAGAVVSFDAERLAKLLRANGQCPGWHYHLIDVEALAVGWIHGQWEAAAEIRGADHEDEQGLRANAEIVAVPPWKSDQLTEALGITVDDMDKHTALGDARWAKAIYDRVMQRGDR